MSKILAESLSQSSSRAITTQQAWAAYVRDRFNGRDVVKACMITWDLSEGRARGAVYGTITQPTIDQILAHRNGGPAVALAVEATAWGLSSRELITAWIEIERGRIEDERRRGDADDRRMVEIAARLSFDGGGHTGQ